MEVGLNLVPADETITVSSTFADLDDGTAILLASGTDVEYDSREHYHGTEVFTYTLNDATLQAILVQ